MVQGPLDITYPPDGQPGEGDTALAPATTLSQGSKNVTTAGTAVALATSTTSRTVTITAKETNTGLIAVGGSGVLAALASRTGISLLARETVTIRISNLAAIFIDSTVSGEGVTYAFTV